MNQTMKTATTTNRPLVRTIILDAVILTVGCLVPTLSHLTSIPLYRYNPMLVMLVVSLLLSPHRFNTFLLAVLLPFVSMIAVGMPDPLKAVCIAAQLLTTVSVFTFAERNWPLVSQPDMQFIILLTSMHIGTAVYYLLKWLLFNPTELMTTPFLTQVIVMSATSLVFGLVKIFQYPYNEYTE